MAEADHSGSRDDDDALKEALGLLKEGLRLQKELMGAQNAQFLECRQQLEKQAEEAHHARQEVVLHRELLERQKQEAGRQLQEQAQAAAAALAEAHTALDAARLELAHARRQLSSRFWRYSRPVRKLLGVFDPNA